MLFTSVQFLLFFFITTVLFYLLSPKFRWLLLLLASCFFYMAFVPVYILILGFTIVIDYLAGIYIEKNTGHKRKSLLIISLVANIGVLCFFKYYNFINDNIATALLNFHHQTPFPYLTILLPIGLSFHTFQAMSYTIEVYRGNQPAERKFGIYALYVMFYPQLVAGPIERPQRLLPQFYATHNFKVENISAGLQQMLIGFIKKLVVADRVALFVDNVYNHAADQSGKSLALATVFFAFQIYCDFSGYTDIAIGAAKVLGFDLMKNFNRPYLSVSLTQFWQRWHISLSTWFRDYLYIPLGGNRVGNLRRYLNLLIIFLISGLWHGANWTFIAWGLINGLLIVLESVFKISSKRGHWLTTVCKTIITFLLICFTWVFFRSANIHEAFYILKKIIMFDGTIIQSNDHYYYAFIVVMALVFFEVINEYKPNLYKLLPNSFAARCAYYALLVVVILQFGVFDGGQFIYFQF
ncbi:MAG: MBOAT family O-acyltransferase [Bacteroidota bacterium]